MSCQLTSQTKKDLGQQVYQEYLHAREDGIIEIKEPYDEREHESNNSKSADNENGRVNEKRNERINDSKAGAKKKKERMDVLNDEWWDKMAAKEKEFEQELNWKREKYNATKKQDKKEDENDNSSEEEETLHEKELWKELMAKEEEYLKSEKEKERNEDNTKASFAGLAGYFDKKNKKNVKKSGASKSGINGKNKNKNKTKNNNENENQTRKLKKSENHNSSDNEQQNDENMKKKRRREESFDKNGSDKEENGSNNFSSMIIDSPSFAMGKNGTIAREQENENENEMNRREQLFEEQEQIKKELDKQERAFEKELQESNFDVAFNGMVRERYAPDNVSPRNKMDHETRGNREKGKDKETTSLFKQSLAMKQSKSNMDKNPNNIQVRLLDDSLIHGNDSGGDDNSNNNNNDKNEAARSLDSSDEEEDEEEKNGSNKKVNVNLLRIDTRQYAVWNNKTKEFDINDSGSDSATPIKKSCIITPDTKHKRVFQMNRDCMALPKYDSNKEDIRILFLDVDGVLNYTFSQEQLCYPQMQRLKRIVENVDNCKIVLSTSWRVFAFTKKRLLNGMKSMVNLDVSNIVIGETPSLSLFGNDLEWYSENRFDDDDSGDDDEMNDLMGERTYQAAISDSFRKRPFEIKAYLENDTVLHSKYNVIEWCAIDDLPLHRYNPYIMEKNFIQTRPTAGLQDCDMNAVINLLNGSNNNKKMEVKTINEKGDLQMVRVEAKNVNNDDNNNNDKNDDKSDSNDENEDSKNMNHCNDDSGISDEDEREMDEQSAEIGKLLSELNQFGGLLNEREKKQDVKVLFLDVDGVLNYAGYDNSETYNLCPKHLKRLKYIIDNVSNCKIVLTTTWRLSVKSRKKLMDEMAKQLKIDDMSEVVIGDTPVLKFCHHRSHEIQQWLDQNEDKYNIENWCAIDDMAINEASIESSHIMKNHFVKCDDKQGITNKNANDVIKILNA